MNSQSSNSQANSISHNLKSGLLMSCSQHDKTILVLPLSASTDEVLMPSAIATSVFIQVGVSMRFNIQEFFKNVDVNSNLHVSIERISDGQRMFDTKDIFIPAYNPILAIGVTENSLISYTLLLAHFIEAKSVNGWLDPDFMYRKYLHLGIKPNYFYQYYLSEDSSLWHACNTLFGRPIKITDYSYNGFMIYEYIEE